MKYVPDIRQVTLLLLLAAGVALPQATSWKGMLVAQPAMHTLSRDALLLGLTDFREVTVLVADLPDALKDSLTKEDIEGWTANRLKNMGVQVVSREDQRKAFAGAEMSTDEKTLAATDRFFSEVYVNVSAGRLSTGAIHARVSVACRRGVFVHPGYYSIATVWNTGFLLFISSDYDAKDAIRGTLNGRLDKLETDWKKCNP